MSVNRLYVCDGSAGGCERTFCKFEGNGDCMHTSQEEHARYGPPRSWRQLDDSTFVEVEREEGCSDGNED